MDATIEVDISHGLAVHHMSISSVNYSWRADRLMANFIAVNKEEVGFMHEVKPDLS